jgi:hypothetical protein
MNMCKLQGLRSEDCEWSNGRDVRGSDHGLFHYNILESAWIGSACSDVDYAASIFRLSPWE